MNKKNNIILALTILSINFIAASTTKSGNPWPFVRDECACEEIAESIAQISDDQKAKFFACKLELDFANQANNNPFLSKEERAQAKRNVQCAQELRNYKTYFDSNTKFRTFARNFTADQSKKEYLERYISEKLQEAAKDPGGSILVSREQIILDFKIAIQDQIRSPMSSTKEAEQAKEWQAIIEPIVIDCNAFDNKVDPAEQARKDINDILKK